MATRRLPIFPLPLVLFPGTPQALHIFEPRYRQLLADALGSGREFGMILRTPGTAERAIDPGTVGCVARVESVQTLPDGRSNIVVHGGERFTLEYFVEDPAPYHVAQVARLVDVPEPEALSREVATRVREIFARVARAARTIQDDTTALPTLPDDAQFLAYVVAQHVDLSLADKQRLLASTSPSERLRLVEQLLSPFVESVEMRAVVHTRARTNGHGAH